MLEQLYHRMPGLQYQFVRELYPHNQQTFDSMVDAIAEKKSINVTLPNGTGIKFAMLEMLHAMPHFQFLYVSLTSFGSGQLISQSLKTDVELENVRFKTYEQLNALNAKELQSEAKQTQVLVLADYQSVPPAYEGKITKLVQQLEPETPVIGTTNIHGYMINETPELKKRMDTLLGDGAEMAEYFDLRTACNYGHMDYPAYLYCNLAQAKQISNFCDTVKAADIDGCYTKFINRAKYCAVKKPEQLNYIRENLPDKDTGKYVVLCASRTKFEKERDLIGQLLPGLSEEKTFQFNGTQEEEGQMDSFLLIDENTDMSVLFTHIDNIQDVKIESATAVVFAYKMTTRVEIYRALNLALSCCKQKERIPYIIDFYNNNMTIPYVTPYSPPGLLRPMVTCLFTELGPTAEEQKEKKRGENISLLYYEKPMPQVENLNSTENRFVSLRVSGNDLNYFKELLEKCEKVGVKISKEHPYLDNGINLMKWIKRLYADPAANHLPKEATKETVQKLLYRAEKIRE